MLLCSQSSYPYWQFWSRNWGKSIHEISARNLCMEETCLAASQYIFLVIWFPIFPYTCLFIDSTIEYRFSKRCHKKWEKKNFMLYPAISYCFVWWTTQICTSTHSFLNTFSSSDNDSSPYVTIPFLYHVFLSFIITSFCLPLLCLSVYELFCLERCLFSCLIQFYHCLLFCVIHSWSYFRLDIRTVSFYIGTIF